MEIARFKTLAEAQAKAKILQESKMGLTGNECYKYLHAQFQAVEDKKGGVFTIEVKIHNFLTTYLFITLLKMEDTKVCAYLSHVFNCYLCEHDTLSSKKKRPFTEHPLQRLQREHEFCNHMALNANVQPPARLYGPSHTVEALVRMPESLVPTSAAATSSVEKEQLKAAHDALEKMRQSVAAAGVAERKAAEEKKALVSEKISLQGTITTLRQQLAAAEKKASAVVQPILPPSCNAFSDFINMRFFRNYMMCSENPTYGLIILREIKRREELRHKKEDVKWNLEETYGLEELDPDSPLTVNQVAFLLRYNENKDYSMRRLNNHDDKVDGEVPESSSEEEEVSDAEEPPLKRSRNDHGLLDYLAEQDNYLTDQHDFADIDWNADIE